MTSLKTCQCCRVQLPNNLIKRQVDKKSRSGYMYTCSTCKAADNLQSTHLTDLPRREISDRLREILDCQNGKCALTGEPLKHGLNCSPDHIVPYVGHGIGTRRGMKRADRTVPLDLGSLQIVSLNANKLRGSLPMDQYRQMIEAMSEPASWIWYNHPNYDLRGTIRSQLLRNARWNSRSRGHEPPTINRAWIADQIQQQGNRCYWSDLPLPDYQFGQTRFGGQRAGQDPAIRYLVEISIDRLDESIGYHPDNCVICFAPFNVARSGGTSGYRDQNLFTMSDPAVYRQWVSQVISGTWDLDWCREHRHYRG